MDLPGTFQSREICAFSTSAPIVPIDGELFDLQVEKLLGKASEVLGNIMFPDGKFPTHALDDLSVFFNGSRCPYR